MVGAGAGLISNIVPILGTATADEIEVERRQWVDKTGSEFAGTFIQSLYSNQGASSDQAFLGGRSQSNLDNQYALLNKIHQTNAQYGATTDSLSDPTYQAEIAVQPYILQQGELLQQANKNQQYLNIVSALVTGGISGGVGGSLAEKAYTQTASSLGSVFKSTGNEIAMWAGGAVINAAQTQYQFSNTANYTDTQSEIKLEKCIREKGLDGCSTEADTVAKEKVTLNTSTIQQAVLTDALIQAGQTATSFSTSLAGYYTNRSNQNTPRPTINTDTRYISPELAEFLNLADPRILNNTDTNVDVLTLNNLLESESTRTYLSNNVHETADNFNNLPKTTVDDTSIIQAVVIYKDLPDIDFRARLYQQGFTTPDIEVALKIRESGSDILYTNSVDQRVDQNETIINQLRNNPKDQSENRNIKVDQEVISDFADFRKQQAEKYVADAKKIIAEEKANRLVATLIDTQKEALKGYLNEAASIERQTPMTTEEVTNHLTELGYSQDDINFVLDKINLPETTQSVENLRNFNNKSAKIPLTTDTPNDLKEIIYNQRSDLLNNLASDIISPKNSSNVKIPNTEKATNPQSPTLTKSQKNKLVEMYIEDLRIFDSKRYANKSDFMNAYDSLINKYENAGLTFENADHANLTQHLIPDGYNSLDIALIKLKQLFIKPGTPESVYNNFFNRTNQTNSSISEPLVSNEYTFSSNKLNNQGQTAAEILGIPQRQLTDLNSNISQQERTVLFESIIRFNDNDLKVLSLNQDGSVTYTKKTTNELGNVTTVYTAPKDLPDTNFLKYAESNGIDIKNKSISQIKTEIDLSNLDYLSSSTLISRQKEFSQILPNATTAEIESILKTKSGQNFLERVDDETFVISESNGRVTYYEKDKSPSETTITKKPLANSLDNQIVAQALKQNIEVNGKTMKQVIKEIRLDNSLLTKENLYTNSNLDQIIEALPSDLKAIIAKEKQSNPKATNQEIISKIQNHNVVKMIPEKIRIALLDAIRTNPGTDISTFEVEGGRVWSGRYLEDDYPGKQIIAKDIAHLDTNTQTEIFAKIITRMKAKILEANQDFILSPKSSNQDTFIDLNSNQDSSISQMAKYLNSNFMSDMENIFNEINTEYGTSINTKQANLNPKDFVWFGVSDDLTQPTQFQIINKEIYSVLHGDEVLSGVFNTEIYKSLSPSDISSPDTLPIIKQAKPNEPGAVEYLLNKKDIEITGRVVKQSEITEFAPQKKQPVQMTDEEASILSQYTHESVTSLEALLYSLPLEDQLRLGLSIVNLELGKITNLSINGTNQAAGDVAGYSIITSKIAKIKAVDPQLGNQLERGWSTVISEFQSSLTEGLKNGSEIKTHEHAGDGVKGLSTNEINIDQLDNLVNLSGTLKSILNNANNGKYGPDGIAIAKFIITDLEDSNIITKIGIGRGNTEITILPGERNLSVEVKSDTNIDQYLDNVKKLKQQYKDQNKKDIELIIGVSEDIYSQFSDIELARKNLYKFKENITNNDGSIHQGLFIAKKEVPTNILKKNILPLVEKFNIKERGSFRIDNLLPILKKETTPISVDPIVKRNLKTITILEENKRLTPNQKGISQVDVYVDENGLIRFLSATDVARKEIQDQIKYNQLQKITIEIDRGSASERYRLVDISPLSEDIKVTRRVKDTIDTLNKPLETKNIIEKSDNKNPVKKYIPQTKSSEPVVSKIKTYLNKQFNGLLTIAANIFTTWKISSDIIKDNPQEAGINGQENFKHSLACLLNIKPDNTNCQISVSSLATSQYQQNNQSQENKIQPTSLISPIATITQTITKPKTTYSFNDETARINNFVNIIKKCEEQESPEKSNPSEASQNMQKCFCQQISDGCEDNIVAQDVIVSIDQIYKRNLPYNTESFTYVYGKIAGVDIINPNICSPNRICDQNGEKKYATCDGTILDKDALKPKDIIIKNDGQSLFCLSSSFSNTKGNICNAITVNSDNTLNIESIPIQQNEVKEVWRNSMFSDTECWQ